MNRSESKMSRLGVRLGTIVVAVAALASVVVGTTPSPASAASGSFGPWAFDYSVDSTYFDGLSLTDVTLNGTKMFDRIGVPAMTVYYDNNVCGPYVDRLGGTLQDGPFSSTFTQDGVRWMSLGITDRIGSYIITQMYYFGENGELDLHMFSKGMQCNIRHDHYPFWRMDFDVAGSADDVLERRTSNGYVSESREFSRSATAAIDHDWRVRDTQTGDYISIQFDDGSFDVGGVVIPETQYVNNQVFARQFRSSEIEWVGGASRTLGGDNDELMTDLVVYYNGFMPHTPAEGPDLWHSTGVRLGVNGAGGGGGGGGEATIGDRVSNQADQGVGGVDIDLFSEGRSNWLDYTTTASDGSYSFTVDPGCYVITFIAPAGDSFSSGTYANTPVCVSAGETNTTIDAQLLSGAGTTTSIGDAVTTTAGAAAPGVQVDLFSATADGGRDGYLRSTQTDSQGRYSFPVGGAGCYVVTFVAPQGQTFTNGSQWLNRYRCVQNGEQATDVDAVLAVAGGSARIGDRVTDRNGNAVAGVGTDLFTANGDGSRGSYLRSDATDGSGFYGYDVGAGCYVVTFIAPSGRTFVDSGTPWLNRSSCVVAGEVDNAVDAVLN